jgi:hypothetical protein
VVPPCSDRISRVPPYSSSLQLLSRTGLSPTMADLSRSFRCRLKRHWPDPRSLAATRGVSIDVLSFGYLDVSVPRVRFLSLCIQDKIPFTNSGDRLPDCSDRRPPGFVKVGFPIRIFPDQSLLATPRNLTQRATSFIASYRQGIHQTPFRRLISTMLMHGERSARNEAVQASKPGETTVLSPSVRMSLRHALSGHILHSQCQTTSDRIPQHPAEFVFSCPPFC